ncbi:hypothetical protein BCV69DRAFT_299018 [Microstroma glucosiphilum]|uniref:Uncharacterized protein n=1 Tax=Pseudomicrostroma glucosiphilum TaxID=1684307 RepID=A0A316UC09_9BASI|nr:hypothetical protein BCV69DRAFT_299018 [Pseudomicrostroma glucosiphilum]PWN20535.1 hypothetical protein BCV69DRAFT_299018 [Pseudomicrostroma glucosiphilum]
MPPPPPPPRPSFGAGGQIPLPPKRPLPPQLWSTRTLLFLSTAVGGCTFLIGLQSGFNAGKREGIASAALTHPSPVSRGSPSELEAAMPPSDRRGSV